MLGVSKGATSGHIKKAWRQMAFRSHPDRGGDPSVFKQGYAAYRFLMDHPAHEEQVAVSNENGDVERDYYQAQAQLYINAWNRVPAEIRLICNVIYPMWIIMVFFFAWPGTAGGAFLLLMETFGPGHSGRNVGGLMLCIGAPLMLSLVFDWWGKLRFFLMDHYSRRYMCRLA